TGVLLTLDREYLPQYLLAQTGLYLQFFPVHLQSWIHLQYCISKKNHLQHLYSTLLVHRALRTLITNQHMISRLSDVRCNQYSPNSQDATRGSTHTLGCNQGSSHYPSKSQGITRCSTDV